jgi:putative spermidine/putrescine transport system permease protein
LELVSILSTEANIVALFFEFIIITIVAILVTSFSFIISKSIAYSKKTLYILLAYIPYLLSPVIMAVLFHYFFIISNLTGTFFGVILAFLVSFPFGIIIH